MEELRAARASMDAKHRRIYLGDVVNCAILSEAEIYEFLRLLPPHDDPQRSFAHFADHAASLRDGHAGRQRAGRRIPDPRGGAFGFSECARAKDAGPMLAAGNVREFARMMNVSQLGDRVAEVPDPARRRIKFLADEALCPWRRNDSRSARLPATTA